MYYIKKKKSKTYASSKDQRECLFTCCKWKEQTICIQQMETLRTNESKCVHYSKLLVTCILVNIEKVNCQKLRKKNIKEKKG